MEIKMNFTKNEMATIEKLHKAYNQAFGRDDHYEVTGPVRFSVNHMRGEATVTLAFNEFSTCDIMDIAIRNSHLVKSLGATAKALFELGKSTLNILEGELKSVCAKYKEKPKAQETSEKKPFGSFVSKEDIDEMNNKAA
jgi:hypothetical protein